MDCQARQHENSEKPDDKMKPAWVPLACERVWFLACIAGDKTRRGGKAWWKEGDTQISGSCFTRKKEEEKRRKIRMISLASSLSQARSIIAMPRGKWKDAALLDKDCIAA